MIKTITSKNDWDSFILPLKPNTFLHSWEWGQTQAGDGEDVRYLGVWQDEILQAAVLVLTIKARRGAHYLIPHGPIMVLGASAPKILKEIVAYLKPLAKSDQAVALRVAPLMVDNTANRALFMDMGFKPAPLHVHAELTWVLDISPSETEILNAMRKTTRHAINKAARDGVTVAVVPPSAILDRFWPLYESTSVRHQFVLYSRSLIAAQLREFAIHNRVFGMVASYQDRDVAAAIIFHYGSTCFYYHGASTGVSGTSPTQLLQYEAIKEAKRRGATAYNFWGIAPVDAATGKPNPKHPFAGITIFKKGFGGHGVNYLHAQDLPLSWRYYQLWLIETLRKIKRGF